MNPLRDRPGLGFAGTVPPVSFPAMGGTQVRGWRHGFWLTGAVRRWRRAGSALRARVWRGSRISNDIKPRHRIDSRKVHSRSWIARTRPPSRASYRPTGQCDLHLAGAVRPQRRRTRSRPTDQYGTLTTCSKKRVSRDVPVTPSSIAAFGPDTFRPRPPGNHPATDDDVRRDQSRG